MSTVRILETTPFSIFLEYTPRSGGVPMYSDMRSHSPCQHTTMELGHDWTACDVEVCQDMGCWLYIGEWYGRIPQGPVDNHIPWNIIKHSLIDGDGLGGFEAMELLARLDK